MSVLNTALRLRRNATGGRRGFTLLELLVVMIILVLLASVVTVMVIRRVEEAKHAKAVADVESISNALDQFYLHCGRYPTSDEGLEALRAKPQSEDLEKWDGPYIKKSVPKDPWNRDYLYACPGEQNPESYDISSMGKDGREGGTGSDADISGSDVAPGF